MYADRRALTVGGGQMGTEHDCDHDIVNVYFFKEWRELRGLSRGQLAKLMRITTSAVSRVESGDRNWTQTFCEDFAKVIGCEVWEPLMHRPGKNKRPVEGPLPASQFEVMRALLEGQIKRRERQIAKAVKKPRKRTV